MRTVQPVTAVTIAKNEAKSLAHALKSAQSLAAEVMVVVDPSSTDHTAEIARQFTEKVHLRPWDGFGAQKNFALSQATQDWVFFLDADEELTPALKLEITQALEEAKHNPPAVFFVRIVTEFLGRPLKHLWGTNPRLLRRGKVTWDNRKVHEQVVRQDGSAVCLGDADMRLLGSPLRHVSHYDTLASYLQKREGYTTRDAEQMLQTGRDRLGRPIGDPTRSPLATAGFLCERAAKQFVRLLFKKRGFLDGWQGWLWCFLSAQYEYQMCKKYLALTREREQKKEEWSKKKGTNGNYSPFI